MKCPICGTRMSVSDERCPACGSRRTVYTPPQAAPAQNGPSPFQNYTPPNKGDKKGCCIAAILVVAILAGLIVWLVSSMASFVQEFDAYEEFPFEELIPESVPEAADESCFYLATDGLQFFPERWDGGPVLNIPETIGGETVTAIGTGCFEGCSELTTIILPDTVERIDPLAFSGCTKLRGLYLPEVLTSIGTDAFAGCIDLEAICIPASVEYIAPGAFDDCASLVYLIYDGTFEDWDKLYSDFITPFTAAICLDGTYYHGTDR